MLSIILHNWFKILLFILIIPEVDFENSTKIYTYEIITDPNPKLNSQKRNTSQLNTEILNPLNIHLVSLNLKKNLITLIELIL